MSHFELVLVAVRGIQTYPGEVVGQVLVKNNKRQYMVGIFLNFNQNSCVLFYRGLPIRSCLNTGRNHFEYFQLVHPVKKMDPSCSR
jgi:hypothetical protein